MSLRSRTPGTLPAPPVAMVKRSTFVILVIILIVLLVIFMALAILFFFLYRRTLANLQNNICPVTNP